MITGIVMGILAHSIPPGMVASLQEGLFDLAYIDDTSQADAEGLLADAGAPIAEADAFKAWGKTIKDGFDDCMKADFPFDWGKTPEDCVDGLHPTFFFYNVTNPDTAWGSDKLHVQEIGGTAYLKDVTKVEADTAHWDSTGKARFRIFDSYANTYKCSADCEELSGTPDIAALNMWYGIYALMGLCDGWILQYAVAKLPAGSTPQTLKAYLAATDADPSTRMADLNTFISTPDASKLGTVDLAVGETYSNLYQYLWDEGSTFLTEMAPKYGVPARVTPVFIKATPNGILGWGEGPVWTDHISATPFTFNFVGGASERVVKFGPAPTAYVEEQMSSAFYHEGLGYVTQHFETFGGTTTSTHSCAWDPDCAADCSLEGSAVCKPAIAKGYDGGKIPGLYFFSPKGAGGFEEFTNFVCTFYLSVMMKTSGRVVTPAKYKGPSTETGWDFSGYVAMSTFKASYLYRRLENCNYPGGRPLPGGETDSQGIDCNFMKDTSPLSPFFGLPIFWHVMIRDYVAPGWDTELANADDGKQSISISKQVTMTSCAGNRFCSDDLIHPKGEAFTNFLHYGYEPHLGALIDFNLAAGLAFKLSPAKRHKDLMSDGYQFVPLFWVWNYLHLPGAINMDLAKLQVVPAALNGFYLFLLGQCMISIVGGVTCCFCGI